MHLYGGKFTERKVGEHYNLDCETLHSGEGGVMRDREGKSTYFAFVFPLIFSERVKGRENSGKKVLRRDGSQ